MTAKIKAPKKLAYDRLFVKPETAALFESVFLHDKTKAEHPHRIFLLDLYHEAAVLLAKKRGIT